MPGGTADAPVTPPPLADAPERPSWPSGAEVPAPDTSPDTGPDTANQDLGAPADQPATVGADLDTGSATGPTDTSKSNIEQGTSSADDPALPPTPPEEATDRPSWPSGAEVPAPETEAPDSHAEGAPETAHETPKATTGAASPAAATPPPPARRGGLIAPLLGGVLAAGAGFLAAQYADPQGWPFADSDGGQIARQIADQGDRLAAVETGVAGLRDEVSALALEQAEDTVGADVAELGSSVDSLGEVLAAVSDRAAALEDAQAAIGTRLADIDRRLDTIERAPIEGSDTAAAALESYQRELAELRVRIDEAVAGLQAEFAALPAIDDLRAEVAGIAGQLESVITTNEALRNEAAAQVEAAANAERAARARAALIRIEAALDSGGGFAGALSDLEAAGIAIPPALADTAEAGVPTRARLSADFGPAARAALAVAHRDVEGLGMAERVTAFFRAQLGIRSLAPREGDEPDAILSRAEAALAADDLATALDELAALPPGPAAEMAAWVAAAGSRHAARAALADVAADIETL